MEAQARNPLLAPRWARVVAACAALLWVAACGRHTSTREPAAAATLADRLDRMPAQAQVDTLRALTAQRPDDAVLAFHTGNAWYTMALELAPERGDEARAYLDSAVVAYQRATHLDPDYSRAFVNLGLAYDAARKGSEARAAFRRAIAIDPGDVLAHCHLGFAEYATGNRAEAMRLYQQALAIDPNSAQAHYNLGLAFAEAKIFREALREWERVVALDPEGELGRMAGENVGIIRQYLGESP